MRVKWELHLEASADDEIGALSMGVDMLMVLIAWVFSAILLAISGIAYAYFLGTISAHLFTLIMCF